MFRVVSGRFTLWIVQASLAQSEQYYGQTTMIGMSNQYVKKGCVRVIGWWMRVAK
jgi:hypothetical protein